MRRRSPIVALLVALTVAAGGCQTETTKKLHFPASEVERLNGFRAGQQIDLSTTDGDVVQVTSTMTLRFAGKGIPEQKLRCDRIDIDGSLLVCVTSGGSAERVDLSRSNDAYIKIRSSRTSWGKTALYVLGVYVGIAILAGIGAAVSGD